MKAFEQFLIREGFKLAESLDDIKRVFVSEGKDLRYYIDEESVGLHIYNADYSVGNWDRLKKQLGSNITKLKVLYLGKNSLIGFSLKEANRLRYLNISENNDLPGLAIEAPELIEFNASYCTVLRHVELNGKFNKLEKLDISFCIISKLILPKNLPKLNYFNLSNNQLSDPSFLKFIAEDDAIIEIDYIFWKNNQFDSFGNTLERHDIELLKDFFIGARDIIYRKKLILLGNTQAGKTTLCDILRDDKQTLADGKSTHGVNVFRYTLEKNKLIQVYDFGGQDFYHNAHLPFYSQNTNFLLVYGNGQSDEYDTIPAKDIDRQDDIFPLNYWLSSVQSNLFPEIRHYSWLLKAEDFLNDSLNESQKDLLNYEEKLVEKKSLPVDFKSLFEKRKIKLAIIENLRQDSTPNFLNQKDFVDKYVVSEFFQYQLKKDESEDLSKIEKKEIKKTIDNWLLKNMSSERLRKDIIQWGEKLTQPNNEFGVIVTKEDLGKLKNGVEITDNEIKLLHDSYALYTCEEKGVKLPPILKNNFIINLGVFTQWLYAILNLEFLQKKDNGVFDKDKAKEYLESAKKEAAGDTNEITIFDEAEKHLDFILAFLKYNKMIFQIKNSKYIVPQYLPKPEEKDTTDVVLLQLFAEPFIRYTFTGFYHTQILTDIIAEYFSKGEIQVAKEEIKDDYKYLIWKNKVVLYLSKEDKKLNAKDLLLVQFEVNKATKMPMLTLSETGLSSLKESYKKLKKVIDFIDDKLQNLSPIKEIRTPNNTYISADLIKEDNKAADGSRIDLIYDSNTKFFYRKGDFPLLIDPDKYPMKKIFISYSKSDVKYRDEFKKHFYPLKRQSKIDTFDDSDLGFGEWNPQILKKIEECDIFVCLVSIDFLNTEYITNIELPHAVKHEKTIIPIKVRECDWSSFTISSDDVPLGKFNASLKAKTISLFDNENDYLDKRGNSVEERDAVWTKLVQQFKDKVLKWKS